MSSRPRRIAIGIEYDGSGFHGWQVQDRDRNVQQCIQRALSGIADEPVQVVCAGRTDSGVHATGQVAHFDTRARRSERSWVLGANSRLDGDANLLWAKPVPDEFHARYSARSRTYRYLIFNRWTRSALRRDRMCWEPRPLDADAMQAAARHLVGEHDFSAFRAAACQARTPHRELREITVQRHGELVSIQVTANAFLHNMVRIIAGVLLKVGRGDAEPDWVLEVLRGRDRTRSGVTAPPQALSLVHVEYPEAFGLPGMAP